MDSDDVNAGQQAWVPVLLDMSKQPELYAEGRPAANHESMNFCRSSKWCDRNSYYLVCSPLNILERCPDGVVALSHSEDRTLQISQWYDCVFLVFFSAILYSGTVSPNLSILLPVSGLLVRRHSSSSSSFVYISYRCDLGCPTACSDP